VSIIKKNVPIKMVRTNLDNLPEFMLPVGFEMRWYQPGDEAHWMRIHVAADRYNEITPDLYRRQFAVEEERGLQSASADKSQCRINSMLQCLRERQCYLLAPYGRVIGTATAWFNDNFEGAKFGRVHWMAIAPDYQGRGLARPLMAAICRRLRELGHDRMYLSTSTGRIPAISLYLRFGFVPLMRTEEDETVWKELQPMLDGAGRSRARISDS
jgi:GNAT superfamily N-acetyltransferase